MKNKIIILLSLVAIPILILAFKSNQEKVSSYTYLAIQSIHHDHDEVIISIGGKEYKRLNLVKQIQGRMDMNPIMNLINQYENEGWEIQNFYKFGTATFIWMRKERQ